MRMKKRGLVVAILACTIVLAALSGCTPTSAPTPIPTSTTDAPVFESDEEALAAATEAYAAYLKMSDLISSEGGIQPERIAPLVSDGLLKSELEGFADFRAAGAHTIGDTAFQVASLQSITQGDSEGQVDIAMYVCEDVSAVEVVDASGISMVSPTRQSLTPFEVRLYMAANEGPIVSERIVWSGADVC